MTLCQTVALDFDLEMESTRKLLKLVPLETHGGFQPHPRSMSLIRLASHVAELPGWFPLALTTEEFDLPADFKPVLIHSSTGLMEKFEASVKEGRAAIDAATDADMGKTWVFKFAGQAVYSDTRPQVVRSFLNHLIHHRAQLGVFLRLLDIRIPGVYGPSADER
jgi:uncharacterized damage-inducible protein DinB